jgi:hypothetical protein
MALVTNGMLKIDKKKSFEIYDEPIFAQILSNMVLG